MHMIVSAIVHGLIYRLLWSATRGMGLGHLIALAAAVIGAIVITHALFHRRRRNRNRRRW
jgi:hypothetical protein